MALCLTRKTGEEIVVGDDVVIRVVEIDRNKIRLQIEAPADVRIMRRELLDKTEPIKTIWGTA